MTENLAGKKLSQLKDESETAYKLICFLGYLDGNRISMKVIKKILNKIRVEEVDSVLNNLYSTQEFTLKDFHVYSITKDFQKQIRSTININEEKKILDILVSIFLEIFNSDNTIIELEMATKHVAALLKNEPEKSILLIKLVAKVAEAYKTVFLNHSKSLQFFFKALDFEMELFPEMNIDKAVLFSKIGLLHRKLDQNQAALVYYQKALDIQKDLLPEKNVFIASIYNNIGLVHCYIGDNEQALSYYQMSFEILSTLFPRRHVDIAAILGNIGMVHFKLGDNLTALEYYQKALNCQTFFHQEKNIDKAISLLNIGEICLNLKQKEKALDYLIKGLNMLKEFLPEKHNDIKEIENKIELISSSLKKAPINTQRLKGYQKILKLL